MEEKIKQKLMAVLSPSRLIVTNQSHLHHGHAGDDGSGESHFHIDLTAESLKGLSRIQKHQRIHDILGEELKTIHALSLKIT